MRVADYLAIKDIAPGTEAAYASIYSMEMRRSGLGRLIDGGHVTFNTMQGTFTRTDKPLPELKFKKPPKDSIFPWTEPEHRFILESCPAVVARSMLKAGNLREDVNKVYPPVYQGKLLKNLRSALSDWVDTGNASRAYGFHHFAQTATMLARAITMVLLRPVVDGNGVPCRFEAIAPEDQMKILAAIPIDDNTAAALSLAYQIAGVK